MLILEELNMNSNKGRLAQFCHEQTPDMWITWFILFENFVNLYT